MLIPHFTVRLLMYKEIDLLVVCSYEVSQQHLGTQISVWVCIWAVTKEKQDWPPRVTPCCPQGWASRAESERKQKPLAAEPKPGHTRLE